MHNLLAIDTSGGACSVCLLVDGVQFPAFEQVEKRHNEVLLPMLSRVREDAGLSQAQLLDRLDAVAFGCGPGSFTGIRIAAAATQAIALAADARVVRVSSSRALAQRALAEEPALPGAVTLIRSRRDLYYLAAYRAESGLMFPVLADSLRDGTLPSSALEGCEGFLPVGEAPPWWPPPWRGGARSADAVRPLAADGIAVVRLAERMLDDGEHVDVAEGLPDYLEGDAPWRKSP